MSRPPERAPLVRGALSAGFLYRRDYCSGCEAFVPPGDLQDGLWPEHDDAPGRLGGCERRRLLGTPRPSP